MNYDRLKVGASAGAVIAVAGFVSLFATYWDDAWHTDVGRDDAAIPPHLLLYGSVAVAGVVVLWWGLRILLATRSLPAVLRTAPVMVAAAGGAATLAAAPLDAAWHAAFGRDAVLWSPPHMLVVFASTAMVLGVIAGTRATRHGVVEALLGGLLLGGLAMVVLEYETDVPQFSEALYLPVLVAVALPAGAVAGRFVPLRLPVTAVVGVYVVVRLVTTGVLTLLDRSTPELPLAILGLCVLDLPRRTAVARYSAAAAAVAALAWLAAASGLVERSPSAVAVVAVPVIAVFAIVLLATARRGTPVALAVTVAVVSGGWVIASAPTASAHDPGQGETVVDAQVVGASDGRGALTIDVRARNSCEDMRPMRVVARRGGQTFTGPLRVVDGCHYTGLVQVPGKGRWFVYAELRHGGQDLEVWLPLRADRADTLAEDRDLYRPTEPTASSRPLQVGIGVVVYAVGLALLLVGIAVVVRDERTRAAE